MKINKDNLLNILFSIVMIFIGATALYGALSVYATPSKQAKEVVCQQER